MLNRISFLTVTIVFMVPLITIQGQENKPPVASPEVHPDKTITFRLLAPEASEVTVNGEFTTKPLTMTKDGQGIWSITTEPLHPDLYFYNFSIDGVAIPDPNNPSVKLSPTNVVSLVEVPADQAQYYDPRPVPHGELHLHWYESKSLGMLRSLYVYTPPGYDSTNDRYPVLYLLHGAGDTESEWSSIGRANFILDNLIADTKAKPMIVVMPFGHAQTTTKLGMIVQPDTNRNMFEKDLLSDIMPMIEKRYRVSSDPDRCAIAGLSMGGAQSLVIGLNHLDTFHWIASFSGSVMSQWMDPGKILAGPLVDSARANSKIRLLWIACGKADGLFERNIQFSDLLTNHGIKHTFVATEGKHEWPVWRNNLHEIVPHLFQE